MTDILTEYRRRHNLPQTICTTPEGVIFFKNQRVSFEDATSSDLVVVLVSSNSKSWHFCRECRNAGGTTIMEVLNLDSYHRPLANVIHSHYANDFDLQKEFHCVFDKSFKPMVVPSARQMEQIVWEMFLKTCERYHQEAPSSFVAFLRERRRSNKRRPWLDEAVQVANQYSRSFQHFYDCFYSFLCINRKYLLTHE